MEAAFSVVAVEDDTVDGDGDDFDDDFDESADERPVLVAMLAVIQRLSESSEDIYLKSADEGIVDVLLEEIFPFAILARPAPHVFTVAVPPAFIQYRCANCPHDNAEDEEPDSKDGVVDRGLFGSSVTAPPVRIYDPKRHSQRDACDAEKSDLGPCLLLWSPCR